MLLSYAVDKRPKVRKCAQTCIENLFKAFRSSVVIKNGSKAVHSMYQKHTPLLEKSGSKIQSESEQLEALHMFNVVTVIVPSLSEKVRIRLLSSASKLLGHSFSSRTRHILKLLEALVEWTEIEHLASDSEKVLSALTSYISTDKNPIDTIISASMLLKNGLKKLHDAQPSLWIKFLPPIFSSIAGYLNSDATTSKCAENILKELINTHINRKLLLSTGSPLRDYDEDTPEMMAVTSICTLFDQMLGACDTPTENILAVISVLFLALGEFSFFLMKGIFLKLSKKAMHLKEESPHMKHVEACIGTAIIAMGPEKVLSLVPISLDTDKATCSNTWILPVLKRYVIGASLQYFMECVVPLAESVQNACKKVKKTSKLKGLQSCFHGLMDLLPAFCRYPTDTSKSFSDLSKLLIAMLKESQSLHATVASAVKELVNGNRSFIKPNEGAKPSADLRSALELSKREARDLFNCYSEKTASRNIKALACSSMELFWVLTDIFWDSPPDKHFLKEAIGCLASVLGREKIKDFFVSSLEKCEAGDDLLETRKLEDILEVDINGGIENASKKKGFKNRRCLIMELASSFVETADEDLINIIFSFIKSNLLDTDGTCHIEAYYALNRILEVHSWFFEIRVDELMDLLFSVKISADSDAIKNRFLCLHYLLVHILQKNDKNVDNKAFLILNEIIITLKTKKESRKLAYNVLLNISCTLKETQDTDPESGLQKLLNMVMGYLSSSSPHITSGAISALSLLIYNDARYCIAVPNLISTVLTLLQKKDIEIIKAALGFIKVLASSLHSNDLINFLTDILNGMLPWSSVTKHHFRSKVAVILEILIRKCGNKAVGLVVPDKYKGFVKTIEEGRLWKKKPDALSTSDTAMGSENDIKKRREKRALEGPSRKHSKGSSDAIRKGKRWKQQKDMSSIKNKTNVDGRKIQSLEGFDPSVPGNPFKKDLKRQNKKRKMSVDEKPDRRNKMMKTERKKDNQKSGAFSKFNRNRRKSGSKAPSD
ncbi:RRP12-like protein [Asparagus officinalis]|uniref:RRP12-like protein n=1 Tax=Asparagus officinalis TaxID=4686 RepID=UPI00098E24F6|nr:RRP12-like protein [Asparagus officinalis]